MLGKRRRQARPTYLTQSLPNLPPPTSSDVPGTSRDGASQASSTLRVLREKTSIQQSGRTVQKRSVANLVVGEEEVVSRVHPDLPRDTHPVYEDYEGGDHGGGDDDGDDETSRVLRDSDDPLRQWASDWRDIYLGELLRFEGRGDHAPHGLCPGCNRGEAQFRCKDCFTLGELLCSVCVLQSHCKLPFHKIKRWNGQFFESAFLKDLGLRLQLGHWDGSRCPVPTPAPADDFVIIDNSGVHQVCLDFCGCGKGGHAIVQLLRAGLWPATTTNPRTAATFSVLRRYHLLSFETKCAALEFYQSLARETDNLHLRKGKDRYHEFLRMTKEWRNSKMLVRAGRAHDPDGVEATEPGSCALLCPACPHPGKNLPPGWRDVPPDKQYLFGLFLAIDANFRLKRKDVSSEEKDPGLGKGWAFFCDVDEYMAHVARNWNHKQDRSHCVAHDAVDKPDRDARGTASSGVGAVDCARHNMKRPNAVGDLQLGERYINMDYIFFRSIAGTDLVRLFVSYDIVCQWHINLWTRMMQYHDGTITLDGAGKVVTFLIPKFHLPAHIEECNITFSFNLTPGVGQTDGEAPERGWADANPLSRSTREMGPGARRDVLNDHFNDWNHKKIVSLGYAMRRKVEKAVPEMVMAKEALEDMEESLSDEAVKEWRTMAEEWEADITKPNPYQTTRQDQHVAKVRLELAKEAAAREAAGEEDADAVKGEMHITELIAMGLQLEDQQRVLAGDISGTGLHPTDSQRRAMIERTSKLRRKIFAWIDVQTKFYPGLANVREREDEERARNAKAKDQAIPGVNVTDIKLWLPSDIAATPAARMSDVKVGIRDLTHEYRLRVGQGTEALHEIRRLLLVRTHLYKMKDMHSRGVRANTRSADKIAALNAQITRSGAGYRAARRALQVLGRVLGIRDWERTLKDLKQEDIRGLPQSTFHDPKRKEKTRKRRKKKGGPPRPLSWIWVNQGEAWQPGGDVAMNEALRIEWAKTRARSMRWTEEIDLLEEEMRRILQFFEWRRNWWIDQVGRRPLAEGPELEGGTAYALRQAAIQARLAEEFRDEWKALPAAIQMSRMPVGKDAEDVPNVDDEEGSSSGEDEDEDEEADAPIPSVPAGAVKSTYVDEVLAM